MPAQPVPGACALDLIRQNVLTCGSELLETLGKARPSAVIASLSLERHKLRDPPAQAIIQPSHQHEADGLCALNPPVARSREQQWGNVCGAVFP